MKLIFIYGPPGVGKLTVAKKLAKLTGYKIFHNQLTVDLVCSLFDFEDKISNKLSSKFRLELLQEAAKHKIKGVIMTFVYAQGFDNKYIPKLVNSIKKYGGRTSFIRILCQENELHRRLKNKSRKKHKKITSIKKLYEIMKKHNLKSTIPKYKTLTIENTNKKPIQVAKIIKRKLKI